MNYKKNPEGMATGIITMIMGIVPTYLIINDVLKDPAHNYIQLFILILTIPFIVIGYIVFRGEKVIPGSTENAETAENVENLYSGRTKTIMTKYKEVEESSDPNGGFDYCIITSWINPDDNKIYFFSSNFVPKNTEEIIKSKDIKEFPVSYEENNIENYKMDVTILKENTYEEN